MKAAVVTTFDSAPRFADFPNPTPGGPDEIVVDVLAAGLHPRVLSQADGSHYTSTDELPLVPGIDGVGRDAQGRLHYFILPDSVMGSMAEQTVIDVRRSVLLPETSDPIAVAAGMNPAMSAWLALKARIEFIPGQDVLILGATGSAGRMAVQVAAYLGAGRIIAAGRNADSLAGLVALGATETVNIGGDQADAARRLGAAAADVDVVLDYVWGDPTSAAMVAIVTDRRDRAKPLRWIEIGSTAGPEAAIPSAALRAARLEIIGSGQGSVTTSAILAELPAIADVIAAGSFALETVAVPLDQVEQAWANAPRSAARIVITP